MAEAVLKIVREFIFIRVLGVNDNKTSGDNEKNISFAKTLLLVAMAVSLLVLLLSPGGLLENIFPLR